jgi:hypothetical protein
MPSLLGEVALNKSRFEQPWGYRWRRPFLKNLLEPVSACVNLLRWNDPSQNPPFQQTQQTNPSIRSERPEPRVRATLERTAYSLLLAIHNSSNEGIWVQEVVVSLTEVEAEGDCYRPLPVTLRIHTFVEPSNSLAVCLAASVYNSAGRPHGAYSCVISPVIRCQRDFEAQMPFDVPCAAYLADMEELVCTRIRRIRPFEGPIVKPQSKDNSSTAGRQDNKRFRRSKRVSARSAVIVEGILSDGTAFVDMTYALVLSAHGCLVTVPKPIELGKQVILRNPATNFREPCRVVYVAPVTRGETQVGLAFETETPEFWGVDLLPAVGGGWSDVS